MTTLIYNCGNPETAFNLQQLTYLANTYQETSHTTQWQLGEDLPDMLIVSDIDRETAQSLDLAEEDIVDYYDAIKLLTQASDAKMRADKPQCDIIMPPDTTTQLNQVISVSESIDLTAMLIDNDLCDDCMPEHIKADLRVLKHTIGAIQNLYPFTPDNLKIGLPGRIARCVSAMNALYNEIGEICNSTAEGKFHKVRTDAEHKEEVSS